MMSPVLSWIHRCTCVVAVMWLSVAGGNGGGGKTEEDAWKAELAERSRWWSLQPPREVVVPEVSDHAWAREPVDRFLFAKMEEAGLEPVSPAGPEILLRRLSFVLTGLPPDPDRVAAFSAAWKDDPDAAGAELVDELLASPHFGERFARHWMDVVRYTDTYGYEWDIAAKGSWEYRDYLIRAFNRDVGFDQLIREHVAGDLLAEPRLDHEAGVNESLIGPMSFHIGERRHGSSLAFNGIHQEMIDSQVDAFSKAFLGMTVACARCHDHKLDAISQRDYYALAGIFMTPRWTPRSIDTPGKHAGQITELEKLRDEIRGELGRAWSEAVKSGAFRVEALRDWARSEKASPEAIVHPVAELLRSESGDTASTDDIILKRWTSLSQEWKETRRDRTGRNASFTVLTDFSEPGFPEGWVTEGAGIEHGYVGDATPLVALEGETAVARLLERGYHTHALSSKLPGAVRAPDPKTLPGGKARVKIAGGEWAGRSAVPQNAFLNEGPVFLDPAKPAEWMPIDAPAQLKNGVTRVLTDFATASLHPNFPPRTGVARMGKTVLPNDDDGFDKRSWFSLVGIVASEDGGAPVDTLDVFAPLYDGAAPDTADAVWERVGKWLEGAVDRFATGETRRGDAGILNALLGAGLLANRTDLSPGLAEAVARYREVEATIAFPRTAIGMDERGLEPVDYRLNLRGDVYTEGDAVPRDFLEVFEGEHEVSGAAGSGRLELAAYLSSPENPQTARVYVNRVWQWVFGTGLVDTPNDFGKLGGRPSHPDLLDWLALRFMEEGWSTKKLVRRLVLSEAFLQSGEVSEVAAQADPGNRLLHHYPTRRLEAEAIRDSLLAVAGQLDPALCGRPIRPHRSAEDEKKRLFSGPLDGNGRRAIYQEMSIMQPPEFLVGFNLPDLKLPTGRRDVTNVPAQALILLNDPFVIAMAERWAELLVADGSPSAPERIRSMFLAAFGREATGEEVTRWSVAAADFAGGSEDLLHDRAAWTEVAHALFNSKEFLYYR